MESNRPADEDRAEGRNTMARAASGDLTSTPRETLSPEEQGALIASGWHPPAAEEDEALTSDGRAVLLNMMCACLASWQAGDDYLAGYFDGRADEYAKQNAIDSREVTALWVEARRRCNA